MSRIVLPALCCVLLLAACGQAAPLSPQSTATGGAPPYPGPIATVVTPAPLATPGPGLATAVPLTPTFAPTALPRPPIAWRDLVTYTNDILGLSFQYPAEMGEGVFEGGGPEPSQAFALRFSNFEDLEFHGRSLDFSAPRGAMLTDSLGYSYEAATGQYYFRFTRDKQRPVTPARVLAVNGESILLFDRTSGNIDGMGTALGEHEYAALVNLQGEMFPGMLVLNTDGLALPLETFEALLSSMVTRVP